MWVDLCNYTESKLPVLELSPHAWVRKLLSILRQSCVWTLKLHLLKG